MTAKIAMAIVYGATALAQSPGHGIVSGTVVDDVSGEPVRKAVVTLTLQGTPRTWATLRTDGSGRFEFQALPAGKYDLRAAKGGIGTAIYGSSSVRELGELITLADGETRGGLKLSLVHSASISGRVFTSDGDPLVQVEVALLRMARNLGEPVLTNYRNAITDDRGEYRITGINPGRYYVRSNPGQLGRGPSAIPNEVLVPEFYGGARESKDAMVLKIQSGQTVSGIDFRMTPETPVRIHGRVTEVPQMAPEGNKQQPNSGKNTRFIEISLTSAEGPQLWNAGRSIAASDDTFEIPEVFAGRYRIQALFQNEGKTYGASQVIDAQPNTGEIVLPLAPAVDLKGQLKVEGQLPPSANGVNISLAEAGVPPNGRSAHVGADGRFTIKEIVPGEYALAVNPIPLGGFLKSAQLGNKDVRFSRFEIAPGGDAALSIVVSMHAAAVVGELDASGGETSRAGIVIAPFGPYHNLARFYYGGTTDDEGKFKLNGIAPGRYKIFALEKMAAADFRNPEAADQLDSLGQEIELAEGATVTVHPKLIPKEQASRVLP